RGSGSDQGHHPKGVLHGAWAAMERPVMAMIIRVASPQENPRASKVVVELDGRHEHQHRRCSTVAKGGAVIPERNGSAANTVSSERSSILERPSFLRQYRQPRRQRHSDNRARKGTPSSDRNGY